MDWENQFSSILRDTENNLARVKSHLGSAKSTSQRALSPLNPTEFSHLRAGSSRDFMASTPKTRHVGFRDLEAGQSTVPSQSNYPAYSSSGRSYSSNPEPGMMSNDAPYIEIDQSPAVVALLNDKIEHQERLIDKLRRSVDKMEGERNFYKKELKSIQDELNKLSDRVYEKGVDLETERKIEQWKRNMMTELHMVQSQLQAQKKSDDLTHLGTNQMFDATREIQDLKRFVREDNDSLRRELESVKTRMVKTDLEMTTLRADNQDLSRRNDRLERIFRELSDTYQTQQQNSNRQEEDRDHEKHQITELRLTVAALRDRIGHMETNNQLTHSQPIKQNTEKSKRHKKKPQAKIRGPADMFSIHSSDLDLSSSLSLADYTSDLSLRSNRKSKHNGPKEKVSAFSEELDDLNLSDVDTADSDDSLDLDEL
ncbi:unnamed protein product [Owenia fusiformis]|uniref:Uncharacterized protein n=1 Tax=Owenia fusiformis TaxID=6347 RepID=A0A8J1Y133_OWEFU|nr:unnamed protein product [Owenia fusiformis]